MLIKKYVRLLNYENAEKVVQFVNSMQSKDYANITGGGVAMQVTEDTLLLVEQFLQSLKVRYDINDQHPYVVNQQIVDTLVAQGVIKLEKES